MISYGTGSPFSSFSSVMTCTLQRSISTWELPSMSLSIRLRSSPSYPSTHKHQRDSLCTNIVWSIGRTFAEGHPKRKAHTATEHPVSTVWKLSNYHSFLTSSPSQTSRKVISCSQRKHRDRWPYQKIGFVWLREKGGCVSRWFSPETDVCLL